MSGFIYKTGGTIKTLKKRWLVLTDDEITYFEDISQVSEAPIDRIYLKQLICAENGDKTKRIDKTEYCQFVLRTHFGRDYEIYVETVEERKKWVEKINELSHELKSPVKSFVKTTDPEMYGVTNGSGKSGGCGLTSPVLPNPTASRAITDHQHKMMVPHVYGNHQSSTLRLLSSKAESSSNNGKHHGVRPPLPPKNRQ